MAAGLPCVGFEYAVGVNELIKHNKNGYLVKEANDMAHYLSKLMGNEKLREKLGTQGKEDIKQYEPTLILDLWENVLSNIQNNNSLEIK